jgi:hypothetical protein
LLLKITIKSMFLKSRTTYQLRPLKLVKEVFLISILGILTACGQDTPPQTSAVLNPNPNVEPSSTKTQTSQNCPSETDFGVSKSEGFPKEVVGLPLGASLESTLSFLNCYQEGAIIEIEPRFVDVQTNNLETRGLVESYYGFEKKTTQELFADAERERNNPQGSDFQIALKSLTERAGGPKTYKQIAPKAEYFAIGAVGMPGKEKVVQIERNQGFLEGSRPAVTDLITALTQKYGQPQSEDKGSRYHRLIWAFDPTGKALAKADPRLPQCSSVEGSWTSNCGLTVVALIFNPAQDATLAESVVVKMTDQGATIAAIDSFKQQLLEAQSTKANEEIERVRQTGTPKF